MGGGGILCGSIELADAAGFGAEVDISKIHVSMDNLPPQVILAAETQERFIWISHPDVTPLILEHYNKTWALPDVSKGAKASVIGKITSGGQYVVKNQEGEKVINARACDITKGLKYDREYKKPDREFSEPVLPKIDDYNELLLKVLAHENIASRQVIYEKYDKTVQGITVIESGQADAGVMQPLIDEDLPDDLKKVGMAVSVDSNPFYSRIDPYLGAAQAVAESMRNVACVGAMPWALTDCLCYGNPEKEDQMWQFTEGVKGVADACNNIHLKGYDYSPTPIISGNVSFYNESKNGAVDPSAIIACLGKVPNVDNSITMEFKEVDSDIILIGERMDELGGSVLYQLYNELGANVPKVDFKNVENEIYAVTDMIDDKLLLSCHDISDGGIAVTLAEMSFGGDGKNSIGAEIDLEKLGKLDDIKKLFSETGGFVFETKNTDKVKDICKKYNLKPIVIGKTIKDKLVISNLIDLEVSNMSNSWLNGLRDKLNS